MKRRAKKKEENNEMPMVEKSTLQNITDYPERNK
jgi:hypothetical protein